MTLRRALCALVVALIVVAPWESVRVWAQSGLLFKADFSSGNGPAYGFDGVSDGDDALDVRWTMTEKPGVGPEGQDAVEIAEIAGSGFPDSGGEIGQHSWGFTVQAEPDLGYGAASRFLAFTILAPTANNGRCHDGSNYGSQCVAKWVINTSGGTNCREIIQIGITNTNVSKIEYQRDGGENPRSLDGENGSPQNKNTWYHVVMEIRGSSANNVADALIRFWVTADGGSLSQGSPINEDDGTGVLNLGGCDSGRWCWGCYNNSWGLEAGGTHSLWIARYQITTAWDDDFDDWAADAPLDSTPYRFRFRSAWMFEPLFHVARSVEFFLRAG